MGQVKTSKQRERQLEDQLNKAITEASAHLETIAQLEVRLLEKEAAAQRLQSEVMALPSPFRGHGDLRDQREARVPAPVHGFYQSAQQFGRTDMSGGGWH